MAPRLRHLDQCLACVLATAEADRAMADPEVARFHRRTAATDNALDHPETVKELVAWLDARPGLQVRYVRAGPVNGPAESFIEIYPASRSGRI